MSYRSPQGQSSATKKAWYMKWWVWLIAALLVVGGIGYLIDPTGGATPTAAPQPTHSPTATQTESATPEEPLDLEDFLTESGVAYDSASVSARKAYIYVPTETTNEQAQQIANDAMLYICRHATRSGDKSPAANRVEVSDGVSPSTPDYSAADHPSGFAASEICEQN